MAARLDLIAHGASAATRAARFPDDEGLEAAAVELTEALAGRLGPYARVLTAPARAARETARALGLDAEVDPALRDCDYGRWRGLALKDVAEREPEGFAAWLGDPDAAPHGGESLLALTERVGLWLRVQSSGRGSTLAVTHAAVIRAAIVVAIEAEPRSFWRIGVGPLSIWRLSGHAGRWNLVSSGLADPGQ